MIHHKDMGSYYQFPGMGPTNQTAVVGFLFDKNLLYLLEFMSLIGQVIRNWVL